MASQTATLVGSASGAGEFAREGRQHPPRRNSDSPVVCCGKPMERRLARAHDRLGQTVYVPVWHCRSCERMMQISSPKSKEKRL
jgi:hypothetical protein